MKFIKNIIYKYYTINIHANIYIYILFIFLAYKLNSININTSIIYIKCLGIPFNLVMNNSGVMGNQ
jgi:hypothetical protein